MSAKETITDLSIDVHGDQFTIRGEFEWTISVALEKAPDQMQREVDRMGQQLKREVYHEVLQEADERIVRQWQLANPALERRGSRPYTFVTPFGRVEMKRRRVCDKQTGNWCIPAQKTWEVSHRTHVVAALREAAVEEMRQHSSRVSVDNLTERAHEEKRLLGVSTLLKIVHDDGAALKEEQRSRALEVLKQEPKVFRTGLATWPEDAGEPPAELSFEETEEERQDEMEDSAESTLSEEEKEEVRERAASFFSSLFFSPDCVLADPETERSPETDFSDEKPRRCEVDPGRVIVQPDEVKTKAQATEAPRKENWTYTATVQVDEKSYYLAEESAAALWQLVGALLTTLGVLSGLRKLTVIGDGAIWIREWFEQLKLPDTQMVLCWYHLAQRVYQRLSAGGFSKERRLSIEYEVLGYLWRGNLVAAILTLWKVREEARNPKWITDLIRYLLRRRDYIPDYRARYQQGFWIASNRVEKWNDWAVSDRCKRRGMCWTADGVLALANFEAADRNNELEYWNTHRALTRYEQSDTTQTTQAA